VLHERRARSAERYARISAHLQEAKLPFTVGFEYLKQGVYINETWYPVLKMDWVEGESLNQFVGKRANRTATLKTLGDMWTKLAQLLVDKSITHADLQHGNIMLIPSKTEGRVSLRLVDYDGMYLPTLANTRSGELGHPNFQHPKRLAQGYYGPEVDRFSHLVIYTALRAPYHKGQAFWQTYEDGNNLLFTQADFARPAQSKILKELWEHGPDELRHLAGRIVLATTQELHEIPLLASVVNAGNVAPLTPDQVKDIDRLLGASGGLWSRLFGKEAKSVVRLPGPVPTDDTQAVAWYRHNADLGDAEAQFNLGWRYANGKGVGKDDAQAVAWYRKAAEQGHAGAQANLGYMFNAGRGVPKDDAQAAMWYRRAAEQGSAGAQFSLGAMYEAGAGVPKDDSQAAFWYRRAAEQGYVAAQYAMAVLCETGRGTPKDDAAAAHWFGKAAEQGHVIAQFNLGLRYGTGLGVPKDDLAAASWYRKAAEQGHATAQFYLASRLENGQGIPKDELQAASWYRKGAEQGHAECQFKLGA